MGQRVVLKDEGGPLCFPPLFFPRCKVERRVKNENEEHVHFKSLGVSPWKANVFCHKDS